MICSILQAAELAVLNILIRLIDLGFGVHDERALGCYGFEDRLSAEDQRNVIFGCLNCESVTVVFKEHKVIPGYYFNAVNTDLAFDKEQGGAIVSAYIRFNSITPGRNMKFSPTWKNATP